MAQGHAQCALTARCQVHPFKTSDLLTYTMIQVIAELVRSHYVVCPATQLFEHNKLLLQCAFTQE